ncbi:MAG: tRNA pseudouridine(55) synthase TruB, partial [Coriobacteriales bacterium]|nr:tRNA pseudouridine(55) synthase TruB [Coriobacteriales bacterium]
MKRGESGINCLLAIDKPVGPSSHDVVGRVRRAMGERRVGHAGTLDPAASGVLVVGVGQGARLLGMLTLDEKAYEGRIFFGCETTTDDAEGEVTV